MLKNLIIYKNEDINETPLLEIKLADTIYVNGKALDLEKDIQNGLIEVIQEIRTRTAKAAVGRFMKIVNELTDYTMEATLDKAIKRYEGEWE